MLHTVTYHQIERYYPLRDPGIHIQVVLRHGQDNEVQLPAKVDTGADYCLFERTYAESLGIEVESGHHMPFTSVGGEFHAYGHEVTIVALGFTFISTCYFFESPYVRRNFLGRNGWLNKLRLGIDDSQAVGLIYAAPVEHA